MLTHFEIAGYGPFLEQTKVELRPLTLIFGRNAVGKSVLVRALPSIVGALQGQGGLVPHWLPGGKAEIGCGWVDQAGRCQSLRTTVEGSGGELWRHCTDIPAELRSKSVAWLGPERELVLVPAVGSDARADERAGWRRLLADSKRNDSALLRLVSDALRRVMGHSVDVILDPSGDGFSIRVGASHTPERMDCVPTDGDGVSRILPVLVALEVRKSEPAPDHIVIEHPESCLHPGAESELARLIAEVAGRRGGPHYVIETHSACVLLGVQLAIAEKRLTADRVVVYIVSKDERGRSHAERVEFDERGDPNGTIVQPFAEGLALARALIEARRGF